MLPSCQVRGAGADHRDIITSVGEKLFLNSNPRLFSALILELLCHAQIASRPCQLAMASATYARR